MVTPGILRRVAIARELEEMREAGKLLSPGTLHMTPEARALSLESVGIWNRMSATERLADRVGMKYAGD